MNDIPLPPTIDEQSKINQVPRPRTPGLSFLRVISLIALMLSVTSFIYFISAVADFTFPSQGFDFHNPYDSVKASFPLFVASFLALLFSLSVMRYKQVKAHDTTYSLAWRRVLYTIFSILGLWVLGGLIYIISAWLEGDFAGRSLMKALGSLVIILVVAVYYIAELKGIWIDNTAKHIKYLAGVSAAILLVIIAAFFFIGSPSFHNSVSHDLTRRGIVEDIKYYIDCECRNGILPVDNDEFKALLEDNYIDNLFTKDPINKSIVYTKIDNTNYQICANFELDSKTTDEYVSRYDKYYSTNIQWSYEKGGCQKLTLKEIKNKPKLPVFYDNMEKDRAASSSALINTN